MELLFRRRKFYPAQRPLVMGILNVTPDSFSDGGEYQQPTKAMARALQMVADGADIIDVGPESTRPGASEVSIEEQIGRCVPVIEAIRSHDDEIPISIDTRLAGVAQAALEAGADLINDVSALRDDPAMVDLVAAAGTPVVLMHRKGTPATMQDRGGPDYHDVVGEICTFLSGRARFAIDNGIDPGHIIVDPGIGFGKRVEHNLMILRRLDRLVALGHPVLVGASRKSFIGSVLGGPRNSIGQPTPSNRGGVAESAGPNEHKSGPEHDPRTRQAASLACATLAIMAGASIIRTHDVRATLEVVQLCTAVIRA
jgi:dihydropteroate synthase